MHIAVDAMGGDRAPAAIVAGAVAAARHLRFGLLLVGRSEAIEAELERARGLSRLDVRTVNAPDVVDMAEPASAVRRKPGSSLRVAADLVASGEAAAMFSAGHTGAVVLTAHAAFGMIDGIERPALATTIPTRTGHAILIDSGANLCCRPQHLVQFGAMGVTLARVGLGIAGPRIGLLAIGEEETKGLELAREAHQRLKRSGLPFIGNLEATRMYAGDAEVILCDGHTGNLALKVSESLVDALEGLFVREMRRSLKARAGLLLSKTALLRLRKRVDYAEQGGAPLLGLRKICVVGHGRSSAKAVRNAVALAHRLAEGNLVGALESELKMAAV
jgi:glycerol-3-phosphate acyltransferase PlsX